MRTVSRDAVAISTELVSSSSLGSWIAGINHPGLSVTG